MIEVKHLKTLQALRNCGSLAAAAATLHQTQSALSHQFSDLEQRLGFRLFVRKSQPLRFTPQGEILLQLANQVLPQIARALQDCNEPQQTRLRLAIECSVADAGAGEFPRPLATCGGRLPFRRHLRPTACAAAG